MNKLEIEDQSERICFQRWADHSETLFNKLHDDFENADIQVHQYEFNSTEHDLNNKTPEQLFESEMWIFKDCDIHIRSDKLLELKQELFEEKIEYLKEKYFFHKTRIKYLSQYKRAIK